MPGPTSAFIGTGVVGQFLIGPPPTLAIQDAAHGQAASDITSIGGDILLGIQNAVHLQAATNLGGVAGIPSTITIPRPTLPSPTYTYRCFDRMTMKELGQLPMSQVTFNSKLKDVGQLRGVVARDAKLPFSPEPLSTRIVVDRNHIPIWDGVVTSYDFQATSDTRQLQAQEYPWLLKRRRFYAAISGSFTYTNQDQFDIVRNWLTYTQGTWGTASDLRIVVDGQESGIVRTLTYKASDAKDIWTMLLDLSNLDSNGFDFAFQTHYTGAREINMQLRLGYPRLGVSQSSSGWVFEYPGNARDYQWPTDGTATANALIGTGTDANNASIGSYQYDSWLWGAYGVLEDTKQYTAAKDQATLDGATLADLKAMELPETNPVIWQKAGSWPELGSLQLGDDVRFRATSPRHPRQPNGGPGYDDFLRVIDVDVTPPDKGAPEDVKWTLGAVPTDTPVIRHPSRDLAGLGRLMADLAKRVQQLEVR